MVEYFNPLSILEFLSLVDLYQRHLPHGLVLSVEHTFLLLVSLEITELF